LFGTLLYIYFEVIVCHHYTSSCRMITLYYCAIITLEGAANVCHVRIVVFVSLIHSNPSTVIEICIAIQSPSLTGSRDMLSCFLSCACNHSWMGLTYGLMVLSIHLQHDDLS